MVGAFWLHGGISIFMYIILYILSVISIPMCSRWWLQNDLSICLPFQFSCLYPFYEQAQGGTLDHLMEEEDVLCIHMGARKRLYWPYGQSYFGAKSYWNKILGAFHTWYEHWFRATQIFSRWALLFFLLKSFYGFLSNVVHPTDTLWGGVSVSNTCRTRTRFGYVSDTLQRVSIFF